jgi:hypothetical protein
MNNSQHTETGRATAIRVKNTPGLEEQDESSKLKAGSSKVKAYKLRVQILK